MSSPAYELAQYLVAQGGGVWASDAPTDWSINVNVEPERPDMTVTLRDDGGNEPETDQLDVQELQINVRLRSGPKGTDYLTVYDKAEAIRDLLIQPAPLVTEDGSHYIGIRMVGGINNLGRDERDRHILMMSFMIQVHRA